VALFRWRGVKAGTLHAVASRGRCKLSLSWVITGCPRSDVHLHPHRLGCDWWTGAGCKQTHLLLVSVHLLLFIVHFLLVIVHLHCSPCIGDCSPCIGNCSPIVHCSHSIGCGLPSIGHCSPSIGHCLQIDAVFMHVNMFAHSRIHSMYGNCSINSNRKKLLLI
jgi:hypothetical protein